MYFVSFVGLVLVKFYGAVQSKLKGLVHNMDICGEDIDGQFFSVLPLTIARLLT